MKMKKTTALLTVFCVLIIGLAVSQTIEAQHNKTVAGDTIKHMLDVEHQGLIQLRELVKDDEGQAAYVLAYTLGRFVGESDYQNSQLIWAGELGYIRMCLETAFMENAGGPITESSKEQAKKLALSTINDLIELENQVTKLCDRRDTLAAKLGEPWLSNQIRRDYLALMTPGTTIYNQAVALYKKAFRDTEESDADEPGGGWSMIFRNESFAGISSLFADIIGDERMNALVERLESNKDNDLGHSTLTSYWLLTFIKEFGITKDQLAQANFSKGEEFAPLTEEEIELLYSGDRDAILSHAVFPDVVVFGGEAYTLEWFELNPIETWKQAGIPVELITEALDTFSGYSWVESNPENFKGISDLEKKLQDYIQLIGSE